ncbi:MAG TPA: AbrB family transcriptional regulator [Deltaproteobacteria bacterium]|nr:MAG: AbrB family transcriptional regulator [Deltaproteobacteria bacterium GWB2_42_7]OGP46585.1 MAG: AbrB family transcriptional regulator [Deltaproteobacteria bacterium GWF2_42_12]OGQ75836.1 MAG: AbrB family transcriptional regulator [Deltaproteobacteria bacterium RIFOXYA2_FULL_42_10]HAG51830.1 AbrB family transcriptional regulator [Deltaproteobacteria bacterium]
MSIITRVSRKSQIVIPKEIRKLIHLSEGDELIVDVEGDRIILKVKPKSYAKRLKGLHKEVWKGVDPKKYVKEERGSWS